MGKVSETVGKKTTEGEGLVSLWKPLSTFSSVGESGFFHCVDGSSMLGTSHAGDGKASCFSSKYPT